MYSPLGVTSKQTKSTKLWVSILKKSLLSTCSGTEWLQNTHIALILLEEAPHMSVQRIDIVLLFCRGAEKKCSTEAEAGVDP